jgi:hypothetical protein
MVLPGIPMDVQSGASPTVATTDRAKAFQTTNNTTSTAVTVPAATTSGIGPGFVFVHLNTGIVVATDMPTTSTVNGNSTVKLKGYTSGGTPAGAFWYTDPSSEYWALGILPTDANGNLQLGAESTNTALLNATQTFTGSNNFTTQTAGDSSTLAATDAFVTTAVNNAIAAVNPAEAVLAATTGTNLVGTYSNGASGVGATFTITATGTFSLDGVSINTIGQRVLFKDQSSAFQNGIYTATVVGASGISAVFTRALDYDQPTDINSTGSIPVQSGSVNAGTSWLLTSNVVTVGTTALTYTQFTLPVSNIAILSGGNTFTGVQTYTPTTNQQIFGASPNLTTLNFPAPSGAVTVTMPNVTSTLLSTLSTGHQLVSPILCADTSSSATTYTCSTASTFTPAAGDAVLLYNVNQNNSGSSTLNVNTAGAKTIKKWQNSTNLSAGDLQANAAIVMTYDGTNWELETQGQAPSSSGSVTSIATTSPITGGTITTTGTIACATCVVASSPGAGIAHFAGSTQTVTSSAVSLTVDISGTLPIGNGGTNASTASAGTIPNATTTTASSWTATPTIGAQNSVQGIFTIAGGASSPGQLVLGIAGASANALTIQPGSDTGSITLTGPTTGGTIPSAATSPITLSTAGAIACATCLTTSSSITNANLANSSITIAGTAVALGASTSSFPSPGAIGGTTPSTATFTSETVQNGLSVGGTAYSYGAPSTTGAAAVLTPATTYTVTGSSTTANFQADYHGVATFTDASAGTVTDAFDELLAGPAAAGGSLTITRAHTLGIVDSTSAASSITGGLIVATTLGTSATSVGIGGGNINAGGSITGNTLVSGVSTGTAPLTVSSTTQVANLNAATLGGINLGTPVAGGIGYGVSTTQIGTTAALTQYGVLFSGGTGAPTSSAQGGSNFPLIGQGAANPIFSTIAYPTSGTSGGLVYGSSSTALSVSAAPAASTPVFWGGAGNAPTGGLALGSGTGTAGKLACVTSSNTQGNCTALPPNNVLGVFNASGTYITSGIVSVTLDATVNVTYGDIICASATGAAEGHDNLTTVCTPGNWIGIATTTAASSSTATVSLRLQ